MVAGGDHRGAGAFPPVGRAGEAAFGRALAAAMWGPAVSRPRPRTLQLRKIRSSWKLKPSFGKASKA
uniref:Uncharacterized protein n=1 Tax=Oryza sativa subsp. japonica TaxID=39947 RepID=Q5Z7W6_ORYSJ|nr:unknown protein [Oryza sativa Japonica Group]